MKVGCKYWASNSGLKMWDNWDHDIIDKDFKLLSEHRISIAHVFPIWPEFPLELHNKIYSEIAGGRNG